MATVIKAQEAEHQLKRLSTWHLADHLAEARGVVEAAKLSASRILAQARAERDQFVAKARQSAYEAAYAQGEQEGRRDGREAAYQDASAQFRQEQSQLISAMQQGVAQINAMKEDLFIAAERDLLDFAVRLATKLTFAIGSVHRQAAIENVQRALRLVGRPSELLIRVHSADLHAMEAFAADLSSDFRRGEERAVHVQPDDSIAPGGCRVETASAQVDATLEAQVEEIVAVLLGDPQSVTPTGSQPGATCASHPPASASRPASESSNDDAGGRDA